MIASLFLLFVAAGITIASVVYGFGGLYPLLAALATIALLFQCVTFVMRQKTD